MVERIKKWTLLLGLLISTVTHSQIPREICVDNDPVDWTDPVKVIVLIIIPVLMVITGIAMNYLHKKKKKDHSS